MTTPKHVPKVSDERLCWLAVRDQLNKKANKLGPLGWLTALAGAGNRGGQRASGLGGDMRREGRADTMDDYAFAVDDAAGKLSAEERAHLRATGELPEWFLGEVERLAAVIKKQR
ncbi:hypothetical protein GXW83_06905 [Streptacidiphilus sp. PB12-B1b]|uniref:hypothetical protein n=1 Tax=Streptacidiphilus sp. PB12-B1b TaxID=2705012 RepID=UPI0015F8EFEA|nr:hypothetical protein [Streptacidiphilus sp. PB12-B1b]QMU75512.1 hypothetical protein GXW83_06905 [Streptacidiphilus sp. PB12-B1b]